MSINVFPVATASVNASAITCTSPNVLYGLNQTFNPGVYTITCTSTTIARVEFYSNVNTIITTAVTVNGTVTINLGTTADRIRVWTDTGSNIVVTITLTASSLTNTFSGTLDTITTSQTYTGTSTSGYAYVLGTGAGGGGGGSGNGGTNGGGGGGAGAIYTGIIPLTGNLSITIGSPGNGGAATVAGNAGGSTIIGSTTITGGSGGAGFARNDNFRGLAGTGITTNYSFFTGSATIGNGGSGGDDNQSGQPGTGYGGGGGGGAASGNASWRSGGAGRPGVVYVLRF